MTEQSRYEAAKRGGETAEAAVIQQIGALDPVSDTDAAHYDAETTAPLTGQDVTVASATDCPAGTPVEIKSVQVVYGEKSATGRFYLPAHQHEHLVAQDGWYVFAVCTPDPSRDLLACKAVPARAVDVLVASWIEVSADRCEDAYAQLSWTRLFDDSEVAR